MALYKICHRYLIDDADSVFVHSDLPHLEIADILVGLQFFVESHSTYGESGCISEDALAYFLATYYDALVVTPTDTEKTNAIDIDMYFERDCRCGFRYDRYEDIIAPYQQTDFVKKLCLYFDDKRILSDNVYASLEIAEILKMF